MTTSLETVTTSRGGDFGFFGPNTREVLLGALPAMPVDQFCQYATDTLFSVIRFGNSRSVAYLAYTIGQLHGWLRQPKSTVSYATQQESSYAHNPFRFEEGVVVFGEDPLPYQVDPLEFIDFVNYVFVGGQFGWNENNELVPKEVVDSIRRLDTAIRSLGDR